MEPWSVERIERRIAAWQPTARERAWERIGWTSGLGEALRQAKRTGRPACLFTHDGRMAVGRC